MGVFRYAVALGCLAIYTSGSPTFLSRATVPYPINSTTEIPGTGGCLYPGSITGVVPTGYYNSYCSAAGDWRSECIPTLSGGHKCICSPGYQLYSDGICKRINPCIYDINTVDIMTTPDSCIKSGGTCKEDPSTRLGFTCDCTSMPGTYTSLRFNDYRCVFDPCSTSMQCTNSGGTCTPVNADTNNLLPYKCSCPAPSKFIANIEYAATEDCVTATCSYWLFTSCQKCVADTSSPFGLSCACNDPNYIPFSGMCLNPCTGDMNTWYELKPLLNSFEIQFGNAACSLTDPGATCYTTKQSPLLYQCNCSQGYEAVYLYNRTKMYDPTGLPIPMSGQLIDNIVTCREIDECAQPNPCGTQDVGAKCTNTIGSYTCQCSPGYVLINNKCDLDECATAGACGTEDLGATCTNTDGSFTCTCSTGFITKAGKCQRATPTACSTADPGDSNPCNNMGDMNATCTSTCSTSYECHCSKGFWFNGGTCLDGNECESLDNPCPNLGCGKKVDTICRNTFGGHMCSCGSGAKCLCGSQAQCTRRADGSMKCKCGADVYYYY